MRRIGWLLLVGVAGCLLQTQDVSGPKGNEGEPGPPGKDSPWTTGADGAVFYNGGNVGIGATAPDAPLTVRPGDVGSGTATLKEQDKVFIDSNDPSSLINIAGGTDSSTGIIFSRPGTRGAGNIIYDHKEDALYFSTAAGAIGERMRITKDGSVGIGTTAPTSALDVRSSGVNDSVKMAIGNSDASTFLAFTPGIQQSLYPSIYWHEGSTLRFGTSSYPDGVGLTNFVVVDPFGKVGIGTITPAEKLHVEGNILASGTIKAMNFPDIAENITAADASIGPGDVVSSDPTGGERIVLAAGPYARTLLGVISTHPGILLNGDAADFESNRPRDPRQRALALAGRVPVKVTLEGGPIHPGDPLTSSSLPGHAMRASEPWRGGVFGTALTAFDGKDESGKAVAAGKVIAFLSLDRTPTCDPEAQVRLASKVGELEGKLASERDARLALEVRLRALEMALDRKGVSGSVR